MAHDGRSAPLSVYMLAEHLDAVLAAGEDLAVRGQEWQALFQLALPPHENAPRQRTVTEAIRALELILIARALKARDHARDLAEADPRFRLVAGLFASGTNTLLDAVAECGDARGEDFDTGDEIVAYIRSRGLIAPDAVTVQSAEQLTIDDSFLVAKRIALGPLMEMAASFLDALEVHYELFAEDEDEGGQDADVTTLAGRLGKATTLPVN